MKVLGRLMMLITAPSLGIALTNVDVLSASPPASQPASSQPAASSTADTPTPRDEQWMNHYKDQLTHADSADFSVAFIGDSITESWLSNGINPWKKLNEKIPSANFGISGDRTQHVLYRLDHGLLETLSKKSPKVIVLLIGTNNSGGADNTASEIADGVTAIVNRLRQALPDSTILLHAIFPCGEKPDAQREKNTQANKRIAALADNDHIRFVDLTDKFLRADGTIDAQIMPDFLHLSEKGYQIWADALTPILQKLVR